MLEQTDMHFKVDDSWEVCCPFPVGYIYMSMDPTSPAELFGGTWTQLEDGKFLRPGATAEETGGSDTHTHLYGLDYLEYYGLLMAYAKDPIQFFGLIDENGNFTGPTITTADNMNGWGASFSQLTQTAYESNLSHVQLSANVKRESNVPAYRTCYCWERVA